MDLPAILSNEYSHVWLSLGPSVPAKLDSKFSPFRPSKLTKCWICSFETITSRKHRRHGLDWLVHILSTIISICCFFAVGAITSSECCAKCKPKYKRLVDNIYPATAEVSLNCTIPIPYGMVVCCLSCARFVCAVSPAAKFAMSDAVWYRWVHSSLLMWAIPAYISVPSMVDIDIVQHRRFLRVLAWGIGYSSFDFLHMFLFV